MHALDTQLQRNYNSYYSFIENAFKNKKTHHRSSKKPWWNNDLHYLRKELRTLQSKWNRSTEPTDRLNLWKDCKYKQCRFNQSTQNAKRKYYKETQEHLLLMKTTNTKKFWLKCDNTYINCEWQEQKTWFEMKKPDGSLTSSIDETLYSWTDQFHRLFSPPSNESLQWELYPYRQNSEDINHNWKNPFCIDPIKQK